MIGVGHSGLDSQKVIGEILCTEFEAKVCAFLSV